MGGGTGVVPNDLAMRRSSNSPANQGECISRMIRRTWTPPTPSGEGKEPPALVPRDCVVLCQLQRDVEPCPLALLTSLPINSCF